MHLVYKLKIHTMAGHLTLLLNIVGFLNMTHIHVYLVLRNSFGGLLETLIIASNICYLIWTARMKISYSDDVAFLCKK